MELHDMIIALANRSGGKTLDFAILAILDSEANDNCESANFGAIKRQALKCYSYIKNFLESDKDLLASVNGDITMGGTKFKNKSAIEVLVATIAGVNSPHPNKLKADEVELISWFILQEALSMPKSTDEIKAVTILGSTRKFAHGPMQRLIDENQAKVYQWCIFEVMEAWPTDEKLQEVIKKTILDRYGDLEILPPVNQLKKMSGYFKWRDLLRVIRTLDKETFLAQWLCRKPDSGGLVYPKFDEVLNCDTHFEIDRSGYKSIQIWEDFGYSRPDHPDAIGLVQVDMQRMEFTIFDELYLYEMSTQDIIIEIILKLIANGLVEDKFLDFTRKELIDYKPDGSPAINYAELFTKVGLWVPDYHGLTEIADRRKYGCPIPAAPKATPETTGIKNIAEMYLKLNGIPHVRKFVDDRRFKITPNIIWTRNDFLSYSKRKRPDGTWTDEPEKKNDHGPDYVHYGTVYNWPSLAYQSFSNMNESSVITTAAGEEVVTPATITGGIMDKVF